MVNRGKSSWKVMIGIMFILVFVLAACSNKAEEKPTTSEPDTNNDNESNDPESSDVEQVLHLSATGDFSSLDPHLAGEGGAFSALYHINAGLMQHGEDEKDVPIPDLAAGDPEISEDKTVYTFTIRDNAVWSNGDPVTADDFVYSWRRGVSPDTAAGFPIVWEYSNVLNAREILNPDSDIYGDVDQLGIKAIDEKTLEVTLSKATPYFLTALALSPFYPLNQEFVEEKGDKFATSVDNLLSNGPFKLTEWKLGEGWTYEKNDSYWNADNVKLDKVNYKVVKDVASSVNLYATDQLDRININAEFIDKFKDDPELTLGLLKSNNQFMRLNQRTENLSNQNIRQAIYNGFDREKLSDLLLKTGALPAKYMVPKKWVFDENGNDFRDKYPTLNDKTLEEAQELWKKGLAELGKDKIELEIMYNDAQSAEDIVTYLQGELESNFDGLTLNLNKQPPGQHLDYIRSHKFDMSFWGYGADYNDPMTFLNLWTSDPKPTNSTGFSSKEYDELIEKADNMGDSPGERWELLQEIEKILLENSSVVPIAQPAGAYLQKKQIHDIKEWNTPPAYDFRRAYVGE